MKTGREQWMKVPYDEGIASHIDPESCGASREGGVEALTGENMGRVFSRVRTDSGTLTL